MRDTALLSPSAPLSGSDVTIAPLPQRCQWSLRARLTDIKRLSDAWHAPLPEGPLTSASHEDRHALRLGPDEWLLIADTADAVAELASLPPSPAFSLVDISDREWAWSVTGDNAARVLQAGCALDLSDRFFPAGHATRTLYGQAEITLWRPSSESAWEMRFLRSFTDYVTRYLKQSVANL